MVTPGENLQGPINGTPVWHFQDDAVTRRSCAIDPDAMAESKCQSHSAGRHDVADSTISMGLTAQAGAMAGALGIGAFSKDLAFALYTTRIIPSRGLAC